MRQRDFRPAAEAVVALTLRAVGWEPIYNTAKDVLTIANAIVGTDEEPPSPREISRNIEQVQQSLSAIFEAEYGQGLAENDLSAAVIVVAELLNRQRTDDLMLGVVTDSAAFERRLLDDGGGEALRRGLRSEQAMSAFDILLRSVCRHLVQVTLHDPQFLAIALQQVLRSQAKQGRGIEEVIANLPSLSDSRRKEEMFRTFTLKYLARVAEQLDFLDIPGIDLERRRQRYSLASAYTPVKLRDAMAA